ncbi:MAG: choice-of-anchor D domain-containing protein [Candidatus Kapabacteria bacterium]|nr:choice-of-anchor D domain-containing protein [Ignavibacteriota bacterium]MCW5884967.1 choice-of-anchor D domain-containing protein [Candidatus Kapabacteria bacterium]
MKKGIFYILLFLISVNILKSEDTESYKLSSYEGLHFMVGFMENESNIAAPVKNLEQKIFISSNYDATLQVKFGTLSPVQYLVKKNDILSITVPNGYENSRSEEKLRNLVEITSDYPIAVYAYSSIPLSTDSYSVIPISNWGKEYIAVSLPNDQYHSGAITSILDSIRDYTPRSSQIMIMAAYDDTKITIIPSSLTRKVMQVGQSYEVTLQKGQSYLVQSWQYGRGFGDMTGTIVRSDKPVGFLTGHVRSALTQGYSQQPPDSKDHLIEMLMPTSAWGQTFVSVPFGTNPKNGDYFKLVTKDKNVVVDILTGGNNIEYRLNNNTSQVIAGLNQPALWRASAPVQLAQFMYRTADTTESFLYDPSIVILPPVEQFVNRIMFNTPDESFVNSEGVKFTDHYVTVVASREALGFLKLDGVLVSSISEIGQQPIEGTNLFWARLPLSSGKHELISLEGRFAGVLFGVGRFDSYAMTLGCSLQNPFSDDNIDPTITVQEDCGNLKGTITDVINSESYGIYYAWVQTDSTFNYKWKIDPISSDAEVITFTAEPIDKFKDGKFIIDYLDKGGNKGRYVFFYDAINIEYPKEILLPNIDYNDSLCIEFKVKNNGKRAIELLRSQITNDSRISLYSNPEIPEVLSPDEEVIFKICLDPKGNSSSFYGKVNLFFGCDVEFEIPYRGDLIALELETRGLDFGEVQVGKTNCSSISITNNGNSEVLITELKFEEVFEIDTTGIFPYILAPGETLYIPVCFSPEERMDYSVNVIFINEFGINTNADIRGTGVAPLVESLVYDFGAFRLGSSKSITQELVNSGNQNVQVIFSEFLTPINIDDNISEILQFKNGMSVAKNSSTELALELTMSNMNDYEVTASYNTNWELHPELTITALGKATLPQIRTANVNFGNINVFSEKELTEDIIFSEGNEILTIDEVFIVGGDTESFEFNLENLKNFTIQENNSYSATILFKPNRIGFHELTLGVIHDAKVNFLRDTAYVILSGTAGGPDDYDVEISLESGSVFACVYTDAKVKIHNKGIKSLLTGLALEKSNEDFVAEILGFEERFIETGETAEYDIRIFAQNGKGGIVKVIATFFDTDTLTEEFEVNPISDIIDIDDLNKISYAAGEIIELTISGKFPYAIDTLTSFNLTLDVNSSYLFLRNENISLNLNKNGEILKYNLNISKTKNKLVFFTNENLINIFQNLEWSVDLQFLGLLSDKLEGSWNVSVSDGKCFIDGSSTLNTLLDSVCVFEARHVTIDKNKPHANIYPNPAGDILRIKTMFPEAVENAKVSITNSLGINFTLKENVFINKGTGFLEFDVSNFANGTYFLKFETEILQKNILFVIIR